MNSVPRGDLHDEVYHQLGEELNRETLRVHTEHAAYLNPS